MSVAICGFGEIPGCRFAHPGYARYVFGWLSKEDVDGRDEARP